MSKLWSVLCRNNNNIIPQEVGIMPLCCWPSVGKIVKVTHSWVIYLRRHYVGPRWARIYIIPVGVCMPC